LGAAYIYERSVVSDKRTELKDTTARLTAVQAEAAPIHAVEAQATAALTSARTISQSRVPWESVLTDFSRVLPTDAYLSNMSVTAPQPASALGGIAADTSTTAGAPTGFTISGSSGSHVRVALVLDRLSLLPWLSNVTLGS